MSQQTIVIILNILLIAIGLYLAFFKSYFSEKGKNLATIEDIGRITSEVEKIKTEFLKETEKLKFDLQYANQLKFSLRTEELKAIYDCYEKYYVWLNTLLSFDISNDDQKCLIDLENLYLAFQLSEAKLDLMVNDSKIIDHLGGMKIITLKLDGFCKIKYKEFQSTIDKIKNAKSIIQADERREALRIAYSEQKAFYKSFNEEKVAQYKAIVPMNRTFKTLCYRLIVPLTKKEDSVD